MLNAFGRSKNPCVSLSEGFGEPGGQPLAGQVHEPGRHGHADQVRGPLRRHVAVGGQQHRRGVDPGPLGHAARVGLPGSPRGVHLPAARAGRNDSVDGPSVGDLPTDRQPESRSERADDDTHAHNTLSAENTVSGGGRWSHYGGTSGDHTAIARRR